MPEEAARLPQLFDLIAGYLLLPYPLGTLAAVSGLRNAANQSMQMGWAHLRAH